MTGNDRRRLVDAYKRGALTRGALLAELGLADTETGSDE